MDEKRLSFIDGLRGVGASMVVLYHLGGRTSAGWMTHYGYLGVAIFFVLSGFVIAMTIGSRPITGSFAWRFAARRAVRLDPLYWASILVAIILTAIAIKMGFDQRLPSPSTVVAHLFYLQDLLQLSPISTVYWTLCLEVQFYLFLLLLLWVRERVKSLFPGLMLGLVALSLIEQTNIADLTAPGVFLPYWGAFALGAMLHWVRKGEMHEDNLVSAIALTLAFTVRDHADWLIASVVATCAIYAAHKFDQMGQWLSGPSAQFLGRISYSLYLFHPLVGWTAMSLALRFVNEWWSLLVGLGVSLGSAWIAYVLIEKPSVKLSRMIGTGTSTLRERAL
jgi:peptidoglycan/LPS O-acetylase OafA/YrhL